MSRPYLGDHVARRIDPHLVSAGVHRAETLHGGESRCADMVRYMEWASEGLAHYFAVESDQLRLETIVRGGPLSVRLADCHARLRRSLN